MKIRFYKDEDHKWYADLPKYIEEGGSKEDLEMILGADEWLDKLSDYGNSITLEVSEQEYEGWDYIYAKDWYLWDHGTYQVSNSDHTLWLCGVTEWVFGQYPDRIYYKKISSN